MSSMVLGESSVRQKLENISLAVSLALNGQGETVPVSPGRDILHLLPLDMPAKKGISTDEGQRRLVHDLASIELQAMELGLRTLIEFPGAPDGFKEELAGIVYSEAEHLNLLLEELTAIGSFWGQFPIHTGLWNATGFEDSLLDRITIVHRHLEGSGLDAGSMILQRLDQFAVPGIKRAIKKINDEEVGHVEFGSRWYREICIRENLNPEEDFPSRMQALGRKIPIRAERINKALRKQAGFTESELSYLEERRSKWLEVNRH